jgi:hypothetical protein
VVIFCYYIQGAFAIDGQIGFAEDHPIDIIFISLHIGTIVG